MKKIKKLIVSFSLSYLITGIIIGLMFIVMPELNKNLWKIPFPGRLLFIPYSVMLWAYVVIENLIRVMYGSTEAITIKPFWCLCIILLFCTIFMIVYFNEKKEKI